MQDDEKRVDGSTEQGPVNETPVIPGEGVKVWVGLDVNGNIAEVRPGEAAKSYEIIKDEATVDLLKKLADSSGRRTVDVRSVNYLSLSSSPDCWFWFGGVKYWIC